MKEVIAMTGQPRWRASSTPGAPKKPPLNTSRLPLSSDQAWTSQAAVSRSHTLQIKSAHSFASHIRATQSAKWLPGIRLILKALPIKNRPRHQPRSINQHALWVTRYLFGAVPHRQCLGRLDRLDNAITHHNRHLQLLHQVVANLDVGETF